MDHQQQKHTNTQTHTTLRLLTITFFLLFSYLYKKYHYAVVIATRLDDAIHLLLTLQSQKRLPVPVLGSGLVVVRALVRPPT